MLLYHRVGRRTEAEIDLPVELFRRQMERLADGCRVVTLDEGLRYVTGAGSEERDVVAVTFDDGTADFVDLALPILVRLAIPVTLYAATGFIEEHGELPHGGTRLSWAALGDAGSTGLVEVGSHTHEHLLLDRLPPDQVAGELDRSIELIATRLGTAPKHFAYPKAIPGSPSAERAVRERFVSAALAGTRPNRVGATDVHRLARSPIQLSDGMRWFEHKLDGGMALEDTLRRRLDARRYRHDRT